jgi:PKD repeat protein
VKTKKQDIRLRELFREKLEYAEIMPDPAVRSKLMRRVARKEFMRFNPARLNIYYLGGILITGITTAFILFSSSPNTENLIPSFKLEKSDSAFTGRHIEVSDKQPVNITINKLRSNSKESIKRSPLPLVHKATAKGTSVVPDSNIKSSLKPPDIASSYNKIGVFTNAMADRQKLQSTFKPEEVFIDPVVSVGCAPMKVQFHNKLASYDSCRWTFGDGGYSNEKDPEWIFDIEGEYNVILQVFSSDGNRKSSSAMVTVHPRPQAHFELYPEKAVLPNDEIRFLNYSTNAVKFTWDFGDGTTSDFFEPTHTYSKFNNYNVRLVVFSDWGCSDSLTVFNAFSGSAYFIDFPNAFIPNDQGPSGGYYSPKSDEAAQVFHPSNSGVTEYQLKIFSKLGILIFETSDLSLGWDGYNKGQLCEPGVYIWKVRGKFRNGVPFIKMGDVTLLKN